MSTTRTICHLLLAASLVLVASSLLGQTFLRTTGLPTRDECGLVLHRTPAGLLFLGGSVADSALLQRIDADGNVLWTRAFKPPGLYPKHVVHMTDAPDGTIIGCGNGLSAVGDVREGFHFKFDVSGNFQWIRNWADGTAYNREVAAISPAEMVMFSCYYEAGSGTTWADYFQSRIELATGNLIWSSDRSDLNPAVPYIDDVEGVAQAGGSFYTAGSIYTNGSPVSTRRVNITKVNGQGQLLWNRYLLYPNNVSARMYGTDIIATSDSLTIIYSGDVNGASANLSVGIIRLDTLGNVAWARDYDIVGSTSESCSQVIATNFGYVMSGRTTGAGNQRAFLLGISFSGDILWARAYGVPGDVHTAPHAYLRNLANMGDGYLFTGVSRVGADDNVLLARTDSIGGIGCTTVSDPIVTVSILPTDAFTTTPVDHPLGMSLASANSNAAFTEVDGSCALQFNLGADTTVCGALTLQAVLAGATFTWQDGSTADTLSLVAPGTYWVTANVACCTMTDTINVAFNSGIPVDLGADVDLCPDQSVTLTTGLPGQDHVWQDGSTNEQFTVTAPGSYWVTVGSAGCTSTDTVVVNAIVLPPLDLGPDTLICPDGLVELQLDTAWNAVLWSDGSSGDSLVVGAPGIYWVQANTGACPSADTIEVQFMVLPPLELGPDTSLCTGASLQLSVDPIWDVVSWNDGTSTDTIIVNAPGTIVVEVSVATCPATDSLTFSWTTPPVADLGPDLSACAGDSFLVSTGLVGEDHVWQDGSTAEAFLVTSTGTYWVEVGSSGCSSSDTVIVDLLAPPVVDLGPDTSYCVGSSITLGPVVTAGDLEWSDGSSDASLIVAQPGDYWVELVVQGCTASDSVVITSVQLPQVVLGTDTANCDGSNIMLVPVTVDGDELTWSNGDDTPGTTATSTGTYWLTATNACGAVADSINVLIAGPLNPNLGPDTVLCGEIELVLTSNYSAANSLWNGAVQATSITIEEPGTYWLTVSSSGCVASDTIMVDQQPFPIVELSDDTVLCEPGIVALVPLNFIGDLLAWSDGSAGMVLSTSTPGVYVAVASNACGQVQDELVLSVAAPFDMQRDHSACFGLAATVALPEGVTAVQWSTGSQETTIQLMEGEYSYQLTDAFGCLREGEVRVITEPGSDGLTYVPNVFSPNGDDVNDVFRAVGAERSGHELTVFNRWGELIFSSNDPDEGWDGSYGGSTVPDGTYIYVLRHDDRCGGSSRKEYTGHVTLLR